MAMPCDAMAASQASFPSGSGIPHSHPGEVSGCLGVGGSCLCDANARNGKKWHLRKAKREK